MSSQVAREYLFNKKIIQHLFCRNCGVQPFARGTMPDGSPAIAVNIRCLEGIDLQALRPMPFDGGTTDSRHRRACKKCAWLRYCGAERACRVFCPGEALRAVRLY